MSNQSLVFCVSLSFCLLLAISGASIGDRCSYSEAISPCTCQVSEDRNVEGRKFHFTQCNSIQTESLASVLTQLVQQNTGDFMSVLTINSSTLVNFPPAELSNSSVSQLRLTNCEVSRNAESLPSSSVRSLQLINVTFSSDCVLDTLPNLQDVLLLNSSLVGDARPRFGNSIDHLFISESNVTTIEELGVKDMSKLVYLGLTRSKLTKLDTSELPSSLQLLNLNSNRINSVSEGAFGNMPNLTYLNMRNNALSNLQESIFRNIWRSNCSLDLGGNPIKCDSRLCWAVTTPERPQVLFGQCAHPKWLFGKQLADLTAEDLNCP